LLVVDDPPLAAAAQLLRGEWAERSGGSLEVEELAGEEDAAPALTADVVIYPSSRLGEFAEQGQLRAVRNSVLTDPLYDWPDVLPVLREQVLVYGQQTYALPLGERPLLLVCRGDLWPAPSQASVEAWEDLETVLDPSSDPSASSTIPTSGATGGRLLLPSQDLPLACALLARAGAAAWTVARPDALFDADTFEPRIANPPFVEALEALARHATLLLPEMESPSSSVTSLRGTDFADCIDAVRRGRGAATLGWPTAVGPRSGAPPGENAELSYFALPGSRRSYNPLREKWEDQVAGRAPQLLGVSGRLVSVTRESRNAVSAFRLATWLTSGQAADRLSVAGNTTFWFREHQFANRSGGGAGRGQSIPDAAAARAHEALRSGAIWSLPRIPHFDRYLTVLAGPLREVIQGRGDAGTALHEVANTWNRLSDEIGRENQRQAYRRHLGLDSLPEDR
jgi:ABC-type glycerol-3-phosphate transport system substrate-binding protein